VSRWPQTDRVPLHGSGSHTFIITARDALGFTFAVAGVRVTAAA
jgi:hypothetical protein